ncbi:MAG: sodium:solute symporter family protein [Verrucomicrobiae bacterium]|nr:sodium:solute symporter family protein [Verrucomicrobiae bacterium]MDW7979442.1 sodium:solute symporter family protein [Verrucomicrobiales bacterium]
MSVVLAGVLAYVVLQVVLGLIVARGIKTEDDYLLAGRQIGFGLATFSFFATWFGAETCIGSAGAVYERGLAGASADPFGYGVCILFMGAVFAVPLWRRGLTTLADLFRQRYSPGVERLAVLMMVPTSVLWAAAQVRAFGQVLGASSDLAHFEAVSLAALVAILYTGLGGMRADILTDFIQGVALILGLLVLLVVVFPSVGELKAGWAAINPERLNLFGGYRHGLEALEDWAIPICGSVVAQELVARVLATRSPVVARRSALAGGALYIAVGLIPVWFGLVGRMWFPELEHAEQILPAIAQRHLPTLLYIVFAGALVSAILSTVDSTLLAAAGLTAHNLLMPLQRNPTEAKKVRLSRIGVVVFGVIAWWLALRAGSILDLVENASAFGSAGIFAIMVLGLFTRIGGAPSAYAALIAGMLVWLWGCALGGIDYPYITSLAAAFCAYLGMAGLAAGRRQTVIQPV